MIISFIGKDDLCPRTILFDSDNFYGSFKTKNLLNQHYELSSIRRVSGRGALRGETKPGSPERAWAQYIDIYIYIYTDKTTLRVMRRLGAGEGVND